MAPRPYKRRQPYRARRKLYVVATEGSKTESIYFDLFNGEKFRKSIHVETISKLGESSPAAVIKRLRKYARENHLEPEDELWVVVDVDAWGSETLDRLCVACKREGYHVAVSNPCFELWLVLHQEKPPKPTTASGCRQALQKLLGRYEKGNYDVAKLESHIRTAIQHASRLDQTEDSSEAWPHSVGTHVYKLVEKLIADAEPPIQPEKPKRVQRRSDH